jgi:hypothetical protein
VNPTRFRLSTAKERIALLIRLKRLESQKPGSGSDCQGCAPARIVEDDAKRP